MRSSVAWLPLIRAAVLGALLLGGSSSARADFDDGEIAVLIDDDNLIYVLPCIAHDIGYELLLIVAGDCSHDLRGRRHLREPCYL